MVRASPIEDSEVSAGAGVARFDEQDCLLQAVKAAARMASTVRLEVPGSGKVWVNGQKQRFWSDVTDPRVFHSAPSSTAEICTEPCPRGHDEERPLEELLWTTAYLGSGGALLNSCQLYDVIELKYWPNFTRLPHTESVLPLCSLLSYRPTSMSFAYRMLRIPPDEAFRFYSAATAAGHVRIVSSHSRRDRSVEFDAPEVTGETGGRDVGAFWQRLFKRISGL
jgi:hypothetical protein